MYDDPFLRPDAPGYDEIFADGLVATLAAQGLTSWSVAAVARWMKVSPPAVLQKFSRARLLELAISAYGRRWLAWSTAVTGDPGSGGPLPARLPRSAAERHGVRVWALLGELARGELLAGREGASARYAAALETEHLQVLRSLPGTLGREPTPEEALATTALVSGLRQALVDERTVPELAEACLRAHVTRLSRSVTEAA